MRIRVFSDLHIEFHAFEPSGEEADLVILAGDVHTKTRGVTWANESFDCPVLYVPGNHEYYGGHIEGTLKKMRSVAAPHVHVLDCDVFRCEQTRFLGVTSWTDFSSTGDTVAAVKLGWEWMNDFSSIRADASFRRLRPDDLIARNHLAKAWLTEQLNERFDGKTVVITHHSPSPRVIGEKHDGHLRAAYANDWPDLVSKADAWIFGHTHSMVDVELNGCRVISNPRGYPREKTGFRPDFMVEI